MPSMFSKLTKKGRRRRRDGMPDGKSFALTQAGIRLLAQKDYDAISMARIAREAGCSVGTLYDRYSDKNAYLYRVIGQAFRSMTDGAKLALDCNRWPRESGAFIAKQIVSHVVTQMTTPRAAGIIRATIKLATVKPLALELFEDYRLTTTNLAVDLLAGKTQHSSAGAVRIGMQIVLGTITDAILQKHPGSMNAGSARMTDALANVLLGYLGLSRGGSWAGGEADGEDDPADVIDLGSETPPELTEGEIAIFDPDNRTYLGKMPGLLKKRRKRGSRTAPANASSQMRPASPSNRNEGTKPAARIAIANPARMPTPPPEPPPKPQVRRKHRFI